CPVEAQAIRGVSLDSAAGVRGERGVGEGEEAAAARLAARDRQPAGEGACQRHWAAAGAGGRNGRQSGGRRGRMLRCGAGGTTETHSWRKRRAGAASYDQDRDDYGDHFGPGRPALDLTE